MLLSQITPITAGQVRKHGFGHRNLFNKHIGISTENFTSGDKIGAVTTTPQEIAVNPHGIVHGGWTATFLDTVASSVAYSNQAGGLKDEEYGLTASLNVEFKRPLFAGRTYTGEGKITGREGNNIQTKAAITDDQGIQVATATALIKARRVNYKG